MATQHVEVIMGERVYSLGTWRRKDDIYRDGQKIGVIKLDSRNRQGHTICLRTSARREGRHVRWCVAEAERSPALATGQDG
jgi:hypothetical protein